VTNTVIIYTNNELSKPTFSYIIFSNILYKLTCFTNQNKLIKNAIFNNELLIKIILIMKSNLIK